MPRSRWDSERNRLTVKGAGYKAVATFDGYDHRGAARYKARFEADGYKPQWSYFGLSPMDAQDNTAAVAECMLSLFALGRGDVDSEFFDPRPDGRSFHDEDWISRSNSARDLLYMDAESYQRRKRRA